ncbi:MAG: RNA polymerase sigma factor [Solirubrobacterales bacterium]
MNPPPAEGLASRLLLGPALRTQPDRRLVTLVRDGYESAFEEIVRRYGKPLGRYAAAIVGSRSEEVTQDAFSKALLALRRDSPAEIDLRPWLYRIVRNTALNDLRDRPPEAAVLAESLEGGSRSAAEEVERREEISELLERLGALPDSQRAAIVMRELEGLGHEEIAAALGMSGGAARQAIYRARIALRDGVGMMIPLPLVRALIDHGVEAGAAGAGGAVAAGSAMGGAGAGTALKVGVVAAVLAGGVGTGLALKDHGQPKDVETVAAATVRGGIGTTGPRSASGELSAAAVGGGSGAGSASAEGRSPGEGGRKHGSAGELGQAGESGGGSPGSASSRQGGPVPPTGSGSDHHPGLTSGQGGGPGPSPSGGEFEGGDGGRHGGGAGFGSGDPGPSGAGPGPSGGGQGQSGSPDDGGQSNGEGGDRGGAEGNEGSGGEPPSPPPSAEGNGSFGSGDRSGSGDLHSGPGGESSVPGDS